MKPDCFKRRRRPVIVEYLVAFVCLAVATILTVQLRNVSPAIPASLFFCAVVLSAWYGGVGPGLAASILSSTIIIFWLPPPLLTAANPGGNIPRFLLFLLAGFFISWSCHRQRRAQAALQQAHDELDQRVKDRTSELSAANEGLKIEIAGRKRTERLLEGQKRVLEMIATDAPLSESLDALILLIEAHIPGMLGSILLSDEQEIHLHHGAAPSLPREYLAAIDGMAIGPEVGSCGTAAYRKEPVFVKDIADDPFWKGYRTTALPHGLRSCWCTPILDSQHRLLGTFAMYYHQPAPSQSEHLRLIEMATHIASIAVCRHNSLAALRESEAKLKEAQRIANIGYWERDLGASHMTWSEGVWRIYGLPPQARTVSETELQEMILPDDRQLQKQALAEALHGGTRYDVEYRIIRPDGEMRFVHVQDEIGYDVSGKPVRMFGTVQDITECKRLEAEVVLREQQLNAFFSDAPAGLVLLDKSLRYMRINKRVAEINGLPVNDHLGKTVREVLPRFAPVVEPLLQKVLATGEPLLNIELSGELPNRPGVQQYFMESFFPIFGKDGKPDGVGAILVDITERKNAEERLKTREQEIKTIVENSPDIIVRYDRALRRTYINPAFIRANGNSRELLMGREVGSTVKDGVVNATDDEVAVLERSLKRVFVTGRSLDFENTWPFPAGRRNFVVHLEPEFDTRGTVISIIGIARDITELKQGEEKLRQTEAELARVARLTMVGELTATIAHEINQPLVGVITNANAATRWLAATPPNLAEARQAVHRSARDGNRASEVIKRIRAFIKKGEPTKMPLDINELIQETVALTQAELTRKKVSLQTELSTELPRVPADHIQLQQVLLNLVVNALDSMPAVPDQPRSLRIRTDRLEPDAVQVAVQDTGVGIKPAEIVHLFEPFYTTKANGLGMGLAISRSIVEAHGGRLWATPNVGRGMKFQFTLPLQDGGAS